MNNNILTLEQIQKMSIDEITDAYRNGYILSGTSEILSLVTTPQIYSTTTPQIYSTTTPQIYSTTTPQIYSTTTPQIYSTTTPQIYSAANTNGHYTTSDIGIITASIAISVGLLGLLTWYIIRKEEERIMERIKQEVISATQKASLLEKLIPIAKEIGERILPKRTP